MSRVRESRAAAGPYIRINTEGEPMAVSARMQRR